MNDGVKADAGKRMWHLLPMDALEPVVRVLEFGARKYSVDNWKRVPDPVDRYYDALQRHLVAWRAGQEVDPESGEHHLAHAGCCIVFLLWFVPERGRVRLMYTPEGATSAGIPMEFLRAQPRGTVHRGRARRADGAVVPGDDCSWRSSLGTEEAVEARSRTPKEMVDKVLRRADEIDRARGVAFLESVGALRAAWLRVCEAVGLHHRRYESEVIVAAVELGEEKLDLVNAKLGCDGGDTVEHFAEQLDELDKYDEERFDREAKRLRAEVKKWVDAEGVAVRSQVQANAEALSRKQENDHLSEQIKRLADFIVAEIPGEPSESEGAVDTAIRVMRSMKAMHFARDACCDELSDALGWPKRKYDGRWDEALEAVRGLKSAVEHQEYDGKPARSWWEKARLYGTIAAKHQKALAEIVAGAGGSASARKIAREALRWRHSSDHHGVPKEDLDAFQRLLDGEPKPPAVAKFQVSQVLRDGFQPDKVATDFARDLFDQAARVQKRLMRHAERYVRAWIASTGLRPEDAVLRWSYEPNGEVRFAVTRKDDPAVKENRGAYP